ncbi:MAG: P22 coat - protein 5 family protein [Bacteroidota bacterium]
MANTLTDLYPDLYAALDIVRREMVGFIPAVNRNSTVERAAIGQTVRVPVTEPETAADNTPGVTAPDTGDNTVTNIPLAITKSRHVPVRFNGEETMGLQNGGTYNTIRADRFAQAMRTLVNEMESDVSDAAYKASSRAFGTAGTTPFGTKDVLTDFAGPLQILEDNGAPSTDLQLVAGSSAFYNLRGIQTGLLQRVNESGSADALRMGVFGEVHGFTLRNSAQVKSHTKGTGTSYQLAETGEVDETELSIDTGSGTVLAGDVMTVAGDTNKYVVKTGVTAPGDLTLGEPGLRAAAADNAAVTIGDSYVGNVAFHRNALVLATRLPAMPDGGDAADDRLSITDPISGLTFEVAVYRQYLQSVYHVRLAWGVGAPNPAFIATLLG